MARENSRRSGTRTGDARGEWGSATSRDPRTEALERYRRGGGDYDAGPGRELLPTATDMDRPRESVTSFDRTGGGRAGYDKEQPKIQDAERRGR